MAKHSDEELELELADESICDDDGDELREPTPEEMAALEADDGDVPLIDSGFEKKKPELPLPDRARSSPDLPRVKSTTFKRFIS